MARHHTQLNSLIRRLRPSPERLAAAAAVQDPNLLLQYRAARVHEERRPRRPFRSVIRGERGGALLLVAAVVLALVWSNSPWQATYAAVWHAPIASHVLATAATSPVTWGIVLAFVVGKPLGIVIAAAAARPRASLSLGDLRGAALSTGVGFTVSLLIASRAFDGALLDQAKVGILATALLAPALAVLALAPRRTAPATRLPATSPCAA